MSETKAKEVKNIDMDSPMEDEIEYNMDSDMEEVQPVVPTSPVQKRSRLLILMGFPKNVGDGTVKYEEVESGDDGEEDDKGRKPKWGKVMQRLKSNPEEASICENSKYPLDDALWIESHPVPVNVFIRLLRAFPQAFTEQTYSIACNNPHTRDRVMKILRGVDVSGEIVEERPVLLKLMGYPPYKWDNNYCAGSVNPNWEAVRNRLITHPGEAKIDEDGCFPLQDALWIKKDPVPVDIVKTMIEICPQALTDLAFINASHPRANPEVLRVMFTLDKKFNETVKPSTSDDSYVKVE